MTKFYEYTATGRYYKVYKDGVYVSQHSDEREAIERANEVKFDDWQSDVFYMHEYEVDVALTDAGITEAKDYSINPDQPPTIISIPTPTFTVGLGDTYDLSQHVSDDGFSPVTYSLTNTLPNGLSLSASTGILTYDGLGSVSVSSHQLTATDAVGSDQSSAFDITIVSAGSFAVNDIVQIRETPHQIAVHAEVQGAVASDVAATVRYKVLGAPTWEQAHPLYRVRPGFAEDAFAGCIFDLDEGQTYDLEITYTDGVTSDIRTIATHNTFTTRSLPASAGAATATPSTIGDLQTALDGAVAGDVIQIQDGTYVLSGDLDISQSGESGNPVYITGESIEGVIFDGTNGSSVDVDASYVVLENFTFLGGDPIDAVTGQRAIVLAPTVSSVTDVTIRNVKTSATRRAVQVSGGSTGNSAYNTNIYNCDFTGTLRWNSESIRNQFGVGGGDSSWSNDGLRIAGASNAVWSNTVEGFGDAIAFAHSVDEAATELECNFAYKNYLRNSTDNVVEFDHSQRFHAFYDNYVENAVTGASLSDNSSGNFGPVYVFRNIFANFAQRWVKHNAAFQGTHYYNNTFIRTQGVSGAGSVVVGDGFWQASQGGGQFASRFAYRNNIHIRLQPLTGTDLLNWRSFDSDPPCDLSYNAWYPDNERMRLTQSFGGTVVSYPSFTAAKAAADTHTTLYPASSGLEVNDRYFELDQLSEENPFVNNPGLGVESDTELTAKTTLELSSLSVLKNAGTPIPGITTGYSGAAPDMGAVIAGRAAVDYGHSFAPAWFTAAPEGQWFTIPLSNNGQAVGMTQGNFNNFTGTGIDQPRKDVYWCIAGGHTVANQNGTVRLRLNTETPFFERLIDNSTQFNDNSDSGNTGNAAYPDGTPVAVHHYGAGPWIDGDTLWIPAMAGQYNSGPSGTQIWSLDLSALGGGSISAEDSVQHWTFHGRAHDISNQSDSPKITEPISDIDPETGLLWVFPTFSLNGTAPGYTLDFATGNTAVLPSFGGQFPDANMRLLNGGGVFADGHLICFRGKDPTLGIRVIPLDNFTFSAVVNPTQSGSPNWSNMEFAGAWYDPNTRRAYFKSWNASVITLDVPADPINGEYTWGTLTNVGGPSLPTGAGLGRYTHFNMISDMGSGRGALIYTGDGRQGSVYMYKLPTT